MVEGAVVLRKVLHVIPAVAARYGGPSHAVFGMCRALNKQGVDTIIATTNADGPGRLPVVLGAPHPYNGISTIFFRRQWSEAFKYSKPMARWLDGHVREFDIVHIHAVFSHVCLAAARTCAKHNVPYIVRPLGSLDPWSLGQKRLRKRLLLRVEAARALKGAAFVHYTTEEERRLAEIGLMIAPGVVVPLGVDPELLEDGDRGNAGAGAEGPPCVTGSPYVLALGRIHEKKGLEVLIDAFLEAVNQPQFSDWRLVIAGDGEPGYVARLRSRAAGQGAGRRVVFTGRVETLRRAAVAASPSRQENFGLSVVEALACGVPALVSPHVNLAVEIAEAGAGWVTPLERLALATSLREVMRDEPERLRKGAAGRALVRRRFTWPVVADQLMAVYDAAADGRSTVSA
jgi:glycosyltransferase involved in cell wall biosynthesis